MTEAELKAIVVDMAHAFGWLVFSLPMIKNMRPVKDAIGYPDLTLAKDKRVLFVELKTETGALSREQMRWMRELPGYYVVRPHDVQQWGDVLANT